VKDGKRRVSVDALASERTPSALLYVKRKAETEALRGGDEKKAPPQMN